MLYVILYVICNALCYGVVMVRGVTVIMMVYIMLYKKILIVMMVYVACDDESLESGDDGI